MMTKRQAAREAKRIFHLCFVDEMLNEGRVREVVEAVLQSRHRGYLLLLSYFQRLVKLEQSRHSAKVESPVPVPEDLQMTIRNGLAHAYGPGITADFSLNSALIGGMRIRVGSDVYDGSVLSGLEALKRSFGIDGTAARERSQGG
jgi:F-type H+-transporting ATPase subunit delta